jgi:hypothetical protein
MRLKRTLPILLGVVTIGAVLDLAVTLRKNAPPEAARLLPGADGFLYANYSWIRRANNGKAFYPVTHDPDYEKFIQETDFDFERDLDAVAFAVHYPKNWPGGGTGSTAPEPRFSEVFTGRFDTDRCSAYLRRTATSVENYNSVDIFTIPIYGRTVRVAILGVDTVAASNHEDPAVIHGIVDRSRRLASPFGGPAFLRRYYKVVQLGSPVWLMARVDPAAPGFEGWSSVFPKPADLVVSASYNPLHLPLRSGVLHMRAEAWALNDEDAREISDKVNVFLAMFHSAEASVGSPGSDADVKAFFDSLQVRQQSNRAVLLAAVPTEVIRKLADSPGQIPAMGGAPAHPASPPQTQARTPKGH